MKNPFISKRSYFTDSSSFLRGFDKSKLLSRWNKGLLISRNKSISVKRALQSALILAKTGMGKTTNYIIPNLLKLRNSSAIVLDPSGEIYDLTAPYLSKRFRIQTLNVTNLKISEKYNPLFSASTKDDIAMIADAIIASAYPDSKGDAIFWNSGAKSIINILINSVKNQPANYNLAYVYKLLNRLSYDKDSVNKHLSETLDEDLWGELKGLLSQPEKVWGSMLGTAKIALAPMSKPTLANISSGNTIDFTSFRKTPTILFVSVPEHQVRYYGFYLSLFFRECFETFMEMPKRKDLAVYMLLDEAGNIYIPQLDSYITVLRKRKVSVSLILQSMQQLKSLYGDAAPIISENCLSHLYYPGLSLETCKSLSLQLGQTYKKSNFTFLPSNEKSSTKEKISLMTPEAIRCMKDNNAIYIYGNMPPVMVKLLPWYKSFWMKLKLRRK